MMNAPLPPLSAEGGQARVDDCQLGQYKLLSEFKPTFGKTLSGASRTTALQVKQA